MKLAFCLFRYFPFGGIQRDFLRIAEICADRGHELHLFTLRWDGPEASFPLAVHPVTATAMQNHRRYEQFADALAKSVDASQFDVVVGFNKMPYLDVYYCGDPCFVHDAHTRRSALYRLSGRYRHFSRFENAVFAKDAGVEILLLSPREGERYQRWHGTSEQRLHLIPPSVADDRVNLPPREHARQAIENELGLERNERVIIMIGSGFRTKGVDRAIRAVASLPEDLRRSSRLLIIGRGRERPYRWLTRRLGVSKNVCFLQGRDDVPVFLSGADMQLHVSVKENTGGAIVEGLVAGLPLIVTDACGYAFHVAQSGAGFVLPEPFAQEQLNNRLCTMLSASGQQMQHWRDAGRHYAAQTDLTSGPQYAAALIERFARGKQAEASRRLRVAVP